MTDINPQPLPPPAPAQSQRVSDIMRHLMETASHGESISIGQILQAFGVRGFAFLLFMLSLLNIVIFMIPLSSVLFGLPMVILAAQMVVGFRTPIFPRVIRRQTISRAAFMEGLERAIRAVSWVEHYIKPRLMFVTNPNVNRVHGLVALIMAIMVSLPIPVFNIPPSFGLVFLGLGMLQRDGVFVGAGYMIAIWCLLLLKSLSHFAHHFTQ
ncbi:MAG TPA: exopolysaccharide biosynthesis protein [Alphaproteobacteria bacterium]|nr:exopolysaccharide biosynthesis protein [Alphaproteobacteria bacterium]